MARAGAEADGGSGNRVLDADTRVGNFRIKGLIGEGAMGDVYLAQDTVLGRRVALKLIRRSVVERDGVDRFLLEARATASFSHPNIVTLHAVGEHEGRPFLALEYLDGESLRARCASGPLAVPDAVRTVRSVAEAVAEAHGRGVIHADLKPENVVIPRDGRVRVVDFGLARLSGGASASASGTPSYMAPERWTGAPPTPAIDIWSLGIMLHELITGRRPFSDTALAQLAFAREDPALAIDDSPWGRIARDCLARAPEHRPSAVELVRRLTAVVEHGRDMSEDAACPFPGLAPFTRADSAHYVGRRAEVDAMVEALRVQPLVPVVGPSGVGKSSFVAAAVLPRLEENAAWDVVDCRPGAAPFASLAAALRAPALSDALAAEPARLSLALADRAAGGRRLLLFIDQFEECFTLAPATATAFSTALAMAALPDEPWRIVLTVRDDFLARLAEPAAMRPHLGAIHVLGSMTAEDLREAMRRPLAAVGYAPDNDALPDRIVADVAGQPASLPLLQFTCRALWERRDPVARTIFSSAYEAMGGASGALASHAERVLAALTSAEVRQVRAIFLALVEADGTRRPRTRGELSEASGADAGPLVELLLERRLIVVARQIDGDDSQLELAHEALTKAWPRLARWLDETHEQRLLLVEVEQAASLWRKRGERDDETWAGAALTEVMRKVEDWQVELPSQSRRFLDAGVARGRRSRRRRRWLIGSIGTVLALAAAVATVAAIAFARSEQRTRQQQRALTLAAADMGSFELRLEPYDWDPITQRANPPAVRPVLRWTLHKQGSDLDEPGEAFVDGIDVIRGAPAWQHHVLVEQVQARAGKAFLVVDRGPDCAPSRLVLQRLPGYAERAQPSTITIAVPTCAATRSTLVDIPAGPFIANRDRADGSTYDEQADLPAFAIDRTEVTRGAFAMYGSMKHLTGDDATPTTHLDPVGQPRMDLPVVGVNFLTAQAFCRYVGKELPEIGHWQKAFRGGLTIDGAPNPRPDRLTVWLTTRSARPGNLAVSIDEDAPIAPIGTHPDDASAYGVLDLAGNVSEWTRSRPVSYAYQGLRTVVGANWGTPPDLRHHEIRWRNSRPDRFIDFATGMRCISW